MKGDISILKSEYELKYSQYEKLCKEITTQLSEVLRQRHIALAFPIDFRVKSWESISGNFQRFNKIPAALEEIGDMAGLRIVLLFRRDQEKVCDIIQECFEVLEVEDTTDRLSADQFGYGSIHFQVRPKAAWLVLPTLSGLQGLQAEIQVRTASQHIWAEASHFLQYKSKTHVPKPLLRIINRAAALLEEVDDDFDSVLTERETYIGKLGTFEEDRPLNTNILEKVLAEELPPENKDVDENFSEVLDDLIAFNINNVKSLRALLKKHHDAILAAEEIHVLSEREEKEDTWYIPHDPERFAKGVFLTHVGLTRQALEEEFGKEKFNNYIIKKSTKVKPTSEKELR